MTIHAEAEVQVSRPIEAVWQELAAIERFPEWLRESGVVRVERVADGGAGGGGGGGGGGQGAGLRIEQQLAGRTSLLEGAVTAWEPPRRLAFAARHPDGITIDAEADLAPDGPTTWLRWRVRIGLPLRFRLFEGMAAPQVRQAATADLQRLKQRLELVAG